LETSRLARKLTIGVTGGQKVLEFYESLAKQRATLLKADGKDILSVKMHLNSEREAQ
jgi:6-phosphogluconolactonase/glucosamine-6-phosphate isomerase/deaminase